ncbi:unnamed protein product, partial [Rotaria socialis]
MSLYNYFDIVSIEYFIFAATLPTQCYAYTTINDAYRNYVNGYGCCYTPFDTISYIASGWYRITGSAGSKLLTTAVTTTSICGASYPGYFNGTLPATAGTSVSGTVCFYTGAVCAYSLAP